MSDERFLIQIILDAQSKIAPVLNAAADEVEKFQLKVKGADSTVQAFDRHLVQLDGHVVKARDSLRSINPTLDAFDRKLKGASATLTAVNRNFSTLERNSAKAGAALGGVAALVDRLEKKLAHLDARMTEMGARKYEAKMDVNTEKSELKIRELERDLERASRGVYTAKTDVEIGAAMAKAEALRKELESIGMGDRATNIVIDVGLRHDEDTKIKIDAINRKADEAARPRIFEIAAETRGAERDIRRLTALAKTVDKQRIGIKASLQTGEFKAQYAEIIAEMRALGATRSQIKVVAKLDRNSIQQLGFELTKIGDKFGADLTPTYSQILSGVIRFAIYAINPLISTLGALGGAFIAVGSSALSAAGGIAGFAAAGLAQALPVVGLLVAAFSRVQAVMKAVTAAQMQKDKAAYQDTTIGKQQASTADAIKQAHQGVTDALRNLTYAQQNLTDARQQGIRTLEDMILAEQRADLQNQRNSKTLATAVASGQGSVIEAQIGSTSSGLDAGRQRTDTRKAVAGGVNRLPAVVAAQRAVDDARRGVDRANVALATAGRNSNFAAGRIGAADRTLAIALSHLDGAEKKLFGVIKRFQDLFMPGGALTHVVDPIISAFATGLDKVITLLTDPKVMAAATSLSTAIGTAITQAAHFFTTGPMKAALLFFTQEAAQNLPVVEKIFEGISKVFIAIARAASGPFGLFLSQVADFFNTLGDNLNSSAGQNSLSKFFDTALTSLKAFWDLFSAFVDLFGALMGPGGGVEEGNRSIEGLATRIRNAASYVRQHGDQVHKFLHESVDVMHGLFDVIVRLGAAFVNVFNSGAAEGFFKFLKNVIIPVFEDIVRTIGHIANVLGDAATWGPATTFMHLAADVAAAWIITANAIKVIGGIIKGVGTLGAILQGGGIKSLFAGARGMTPVTPLFVEVVNQIPGMGPRGVPGEPVPPGGAASEGSALARVLKFATRAAPWVVAADALINADPAGQTPAQEHAALAQAHRAGQGQGFQGGEAGTISGMSGRQIADAARGTADELKNESKQLDAVNKSIDDLNAKGAPQWMLNPLEKQRDSLTKSITDWKNYSKEIDNVLSGRVRQTLKETEGNFEGMRISTRAHLKDIMKATHDNMSTIAMELGSKSEQGKQALAQNFQDAAKQIQKSMDAGLISTKTGLQKIENLLDARLQLYGFTKEEAHKFNQITTVETNRGHAGGGWVGRVNGWIGNAGERGRDVVRTVVGRGEAVLNWAQQRAVNLAMTGRDTLDGIFKRTNSSHAGMGSDGFSGGGFVNSPGAHIDTGAERTIASDLARLGKFLGVTFYPAGPRSARRTPQENAQVGGSPTSNHLLGRAMDVAPDIIKTVSNAILNRFGLNRPMPGGWLSPDGSVHDERNHIELLAGAIQGAISNIPGVAGGATTAAAFNPLKNLQTALPGLLGSNVQGAVGLYRAVLNKVAHQAFDKSGQGAGASGGFDNLPGGGGGSPAANRQLAQRMFKKAQSRLGGNFSMLDYIIMHESSYKTNAAYDKNDPFNHAYGIPQANPGTKMASAGPGWKTDAATQLRWMFDYLLSRYGGLPQAYDYKVAHGVYENGGRVNGIGAVPAILHGDEHVWTKREVESAGGHGVMVLLRKLLGGGGQGRGGSYQNGGLVHGYDDVDPSRIPKGAGFVASYVDVYGNGYYKAKRRFPHIPVVSISARHHDNARADVYDVESGAKTVAETVYALKHGLTKGVYGGAAALAQIRHAVGHAFPQWVAAWPGSGAYKGAKVGPYGAHQYIGDHGGTTSDTDVASREFLKAVTGKATGGTGKSTAGKSPASYTNTKLVRRFAELAGASSSLNFDDSAKAVETIVKRLSGIKIKTKKALDRFAASLDTLGDATSNVITNMLAAVDARTSRARVAIQRLLYGSGAKRTHLGGAQQDIHIAQQITGSHDPGLVGAVSEARAGGVSDLDVLSQQRQGFVLARKENDKLMAQAARGLAAAQKAHNAKAAQVFKGQVAIAKANGDKIAASLAQNAQDTIERREQMQNDIFTATNSFFDRQNAMTQRWQRITAALGITSGNQGLFQQQISSAGSQITALQGQLAAAQHTGNIDLVHQIQDKIADLNTTIVELTAQKLQDSIDQINNDAQRKLSGVSLQQRIADVTEKAGNAVGAAQARGAALSNQGDIIAAQRNSLYGLLSTASSEGNQGAVNSLTDQIAELDTQIAENTQAIKDNNVAIRQASIDAITHRGAFQTGVFGGLGQLLTSLGAVSGSTDIAGQADLIRKTIANLGGTSGGLRQQLFEGYGVDTRGQSGADLVTTLKNLDYTGIEANFSQAQTDQFENLINAIIDNATAVASNTDTLQQLTGATTQSFSSTAWQFFRQAIFNGSGGLLPQYVIPQMHTGGMVTKAGVFDLAIGERVVTTGDQNNTGDFHEGDTILQVTSPTEVLDPTYVAEVLHFKKSTSRAT